MSIVSDANAVLLLLLTYSWKLWVLDAQDQLDSAPCCKPKVINLIPTSLIYVMSCN